MALRGFLVVMAFVVAIAAPAVAEEFIVGDDKGWMYGSDYQKWAEGKQFSVGDTLVFNYMSGQHNVIKVDKADQLDNCEAPDSVKPITTGKDRVTLDKEGDHYFICGVEGHCSDGNMKLTVTAMGTMKIMK